MMGLGWTEIAVILAVAFLLFGAKRLPEMGRSVGKGLREFKKGLTAVSESTEEESKSKTKKA